MRNTNNKSIKSASNEQAFLNSRTVYLILIRSALIGTLTLCISACQTTPGAKGCRIEGPSELMPQQVRQVRLGMSQKALESLLGPADYSPTEGIFYFSTGGDCPLQNTDRVGPCGLVAEFRDYNRDGALTESLQACWWGTIGE